MRVVVGRIGKPHGLRGDVTVEIRTDEPERHFRVGGVLLTQRGPLTVDAVRWTGRPAVHFVEIADRTAAEGWRDVLLEVERPDDERPEDPDEFYDHQLIGLRVRVDDSDLGVVREVIHLPAHDLLAVDLPDGREVLLPFVSEVVTDIDLPGGCVIAVLPDGLLEL